MNKSKYLLKRLIVISAIVITFFVAIYIILSIYLTRKAKFIVESINGKEGIWSEELEHMLDYCISEDIAYQVNYRTRNFRYNEEQWNSYSEWRNSWIETVNECGNFYTFFTFEGAITSYKYSQGAVSSIDGTSLGGARDVECQLFFELKDWKWYVVDFYESP